MKTLETVPQFLCADFMQVNVQGFLGMRRRNMTIVYVQMLIDYSHGTSARAQKGHGLHE